MKKEYTYEVKISIEIPDEKLVNVSETEIEEGFKTATETIESKIEQIEFDLGNFEIDSIVLLKT